MGTSEEILVFNRIRLGIEKMVDWNPILSPLNQLALP